jgi:hypothetical protein
VALPIVVRSVDTLPNSCNSGLPIRLYLVETDAQVSRETGTDFQKSRERSLGGKPAYLT